MELYKSKEARKLVAEVNQTKYHVIALVTSKMCRLWSNFKPGENRAEQVGASCVRKRRLSPNLLTKTLIFRDLRNIHGAPATKNY